MGNVKMSLVERSAYNARIAKGGFITSVPIYGNANPDLVTQNIQNASKIVFPLSSKLSIYCFTGFPPPQMPFIALTGR
jgi:hypothetical protein